MTGVVNSHVVQLFYIMIGSFDDDCLKLTAVNVGLEFIYEKEEKIGCIY